MGPRGNASAMAFSLMIRLFRYTRGSLCAWAWLERGCESSVVGLLSTQVCILGAHIRCV